MILIAGDAFGKGELDAARAEAANARRRWHGRRIGHLAAACLGVDSKATLESIKGRWQIQGVNASELNELLQARPFHPLTIRLGSGKTYAIPHPEFAALSPSGDTLIVWLSQNGGHDVLDVPLIEGVEVRKQAARRS